MSEWKKIENPVASGASDPDADLLGSGALAVPPHRPRKKRSDAGKKRAKPAPSAAGEGTPAAEAASLESAGQQGQAAPSASAGRAEGGAGPAPEAPDSPAKAGGAAPAAESEGEPKPAESPAESPETGPSAEPPLKTPAADSPPEEGAAPEPSAAEDSTAAGDGAAHGWVRAAAGTPEPAAAPSSAPQADGPAPAGKAAASARYTRTGQRRGRRRWAAPLGLLILLLAAVGVVSLAVSGIRAVQKSQDDTALKEELYDFLLPVMQYIPSAFESVDGNQQDTLILAAIWRVTNAEQIRQLQEKDSVSRYASDDLGRMLIPLEEINASYAVLFGEDAEPYHHTIGEEGMSFTFEYDPDEGCYHVPIVSSSSMYVPVIDTLKKKGDTIEVRVGYVLSTKIGIDDRGEEIPPTAADADYFQIYTVQQVGEDGWKLLSIADEEGSSRTTSIAAETTTSAADTAAETTAVATPATTAA